MTTNGNSLHMPLGFTESQATRTEDSRPASYQAQAWVLPSPSPPSSPILSHCLTLRGFPSSLGSKAQVLLDFHGQLCLLCETGSPLKTDTYGLGPSRF